MSYLDNSAEERQPCDRWSPADMLTSWASDTHECTNCGGIRRECGNCGKDHHVGGWQSCVRKDGSDASAKTE